MNGKSKKVIETEQWVDNYILQHGYPPTYEELQVHFNLASKSAAYSRCAKFRGKMNKRKNTNMDAQAKAEELIEKFKKHAHKEKDTFGFYSLATHVEHAKQCALIALEYAENELREYLLDIDELQNAEHKMREIQEVKTIILTIK